MIKIYKNNEKLTFKNIILKVLVLCLVTAFTILCFAGKNFVVNASEINDYVILGGDSIGLNLNTSVYVTGKYEVQTANGSVKPWSNSNIEVNDIIYMIDDKKVTSVDDLKSIVKREGKHSIELYRENELISTTINSYINNQGKYALGLYVKDNILGVGTMTYYDKESKKFASLGHSAVNGATCTGILTRSYVSGITKGVRGIPGEKKAYLDSTEIGTITLNNDYGVFGTITNNSLSNDLINSDDLIKLGSKDDVHTGKATITTVIQGDKKEEFAINITEVKKQSTPNIKGIKFEVTDPVLLEKTGGIIQGMSGSPIVQDGILVGAVSHVLVDDSKTGYGVFVEFMTSYT